MPNQRKYLQQAAGQQYPHMGKLLYKAILHSGKSQAGVSRELGIAQTGLSRYFQQPSLQAGILWKAGLVIRHNFFSELAEAFPASAHKTPTAHDAVLAARDARIAELEKELAIYKEIVMGRKG